MKFSLKFKILSGLGFLIILCTSFNLIYSYNLFVDDKTSYIFENGLKKTENISDLINFRINEISARTELYSTLINTPTIDFEKIINKQDEAILTGAIAGPSENFNIKQQYSNTKLLNHSVNSYNVSTETLNKEIFAKIKSLPSNQKSAVWIYSPVKNLNFLCNFTRSRDNTIFFSIFDISPVVESFYKDHVYNNSIKSLDAVQKTDPMETWLNDLDYKRSKKGTIQKNIDGEDFLISYAFVNEKIVATTSIRAKDAFSITRFLILKTGLFAVFLIGISLIVGIYFSSTITQPIINLTNLAKKVADGDFTAKSDIKTDDELKILGNTFDFMNEKIQALLKSKEELIQMLEDYNKNLEIKVEQRTIELKQANDFMGLMVNSLDQGLLVFDQDLNCNPMFTKACEPLLGVSPLNKNLPEVLGIEDEEKVNQLKQWSMITFNEMIPFESAVELGPRDKITGANFTENNYKNVQMNYYPMRDDGGKISNLVLIATDKTKEVQAIELSKKNEAHVSMILKILNNKAQFESFVSEVESILDQFNEAYSLEKNKIEFDLCMMLFHTLNGGFGIYNLLELQQLARSYETEISAIKDINPDPQEYIPFLQGHVENLRMEFLNFKIYLDSLIGTKFSTNQKFSEIPMQKLLELRKLVESTGNQELITFYTENMIKTPILEYFKIYDDLCKTTAVKINKSFEGIRFHNGDLKIEAAPYAEFFNVLVHLFRNCLDHGLEDPRTRESSGKSPTGQIEVFFDEIKKDDKKRLSVIVRDDGAGIDPKKIRAKYGQMRPDDDISALSDKEVIYKIFDPFFSTRDEVSALSGRGVGMSAIKEVIERLNGELKIESVVGLGSTFTFSIPLE